MEAPRIDDVGRGALKKQKGRRNEGDLRLWSSFGRESTYFQREAQVNFWTVLGGLAMAAMLTELSPLLAELRLGRWHLLFYLSSSLLVISISWVQTAWGSLVLKWPISAYSTLIVMLQMLSQSLQCLLITNPAGWLAATSAVIFFALALQIYFAKSGGWSLFSPEMISRIKITNLAYLFFFLVSASGSIHLFLAPTRVAEGVWGGVTMIMAVSALVMQQAGMNKEKKFFGIP